MYELRVPIWRVLQCFEIIAHTNFWLHYEFTRGVWSVEVALILDVLSALLSLKMDGKLCIEGILKFFFHQLPLRTTGQNNFIQCCT